MKLSLHFQGCTINPEGNQGMTHHGQDPRGPGSSSRLVAPPREDQSRLLAHAPAGSAFSLRQRGEGKAGGQHTTGSARRARQPTFYPSGCMSLCPTSLRSSPGDGVGGWGGVEAISFCSQGPPWLSHMPAEPRSCPDSDSARPISSSTQQFRVSVAPCGS